MTLLGCVSPLPACESFGYDWPDIGQEETLRYVRADEVEAHGGREDGSGLEEEVQVHRAGCVISCQSSWCKMPVGESPARTEGESERGAQHGKADG